MTPEQTPEIHVVLVPGYWLGAWAWDDVLPPLRDAGLAPHAVTPPGQGGGDGSAVTLDDQVAAVRDLVDDLEGDVVLVGHSGGAPVVQMVTDQRPERVGRTVYVDAGPMRDGVAPFPETPSEISHSPFPDDAQLAAAELSAQGVDLAALRSRAVRQPTGVMRSPVRVRDRRRLAVPVTVIATSLPSALVRQLAAAGKLPTELFEYADVELVDLPTGHWPMLSRPVELGQAIADAARA